MHLCLDLETRPSHREVATAASTLLVRLDRSLLPWQTPAFTPQMMVELNSLLWRNSIHPHCRPFR